MCVVREQLGYVVESDLDLILVLDAHTGGPMIRLLAERAGLKLGSDVRAARSTLRCGGTRETDVEVTWAGGALLIEDKVDAAFTPGQPESYRVEVTARCTPGSGETVRSVLVCPGRRRAHYELECGDFFDAIVTCEELVAVAEAEGDRFGEAAAMVMRAAASPKPGRPTSPVDVERSEWGDEYRRVVGELLAGQAVLRLGPNSLRTATAEWMYFPSARIDPEAVWSFGHWLPGGEVRMDLMVAEAPTGLPEGAVVVQKPTMWWVHLPVPSITFERSASDQRDAIEAAVRAVLALRAWAADAGLRPRPRPGQAQ